METQSLLIQQTTSPNPFPSLMQKGRQTYVRISLQRRFLWREKKKKQLKSLERRGPSPQLLPPHHPKGKFAHGEEAQARALPHQFFLHNNRYSFSNFCLFCWFVVFFCFEALGLAEGSPKSDGTEPKVSKTRPNERKACDEGSRPLAPEPSPKGGCSRFPRLANAGSSARRSSLLDSNQPPLN